MYVAIELATVVLDVMLLSIYLKGLYLNYVRNYFVACIFFAAYAVGLCVISFLPFNLFLNLGYGFISYLVLSKLLFDAKWITAFYSSLLLSTVYIIVDTVCTGIIALFGIPTDNLYVSGNNRIFYIVLAKLIQFFCIFLIIKLTKWKKSQDSLIEAIPLLLCQVFSIFICYIMYLAASEKSTDITWSFVAGAVGVLYINIIVFMYIEKIKKENEIKKQNELADLLYKTKLEYFNQVNEDQYETRALWHDIKKYLNTMNELINRNDITHAKECINHVEELFNGIGNVVDVGNTVISAVLNAGIQKARRLDVETELDIRVKPDLNISAADLSVIVGNTFDNAVEACRQSRCQDKRISIQLIQKGTILFYEIKNPYDKTESIVKENPKLHGFGLKNVKRCVDRYKGTMTVDTEENKFVVSIHINIPYETTTAQLVS